MTYEQTLHQIHSYRRFSACATLTRMRKLMELLHKPQDKLRFVHVAGTNGKGSTATMIASALTAAGYKTGLTISPFILDFRERMQIDGKLIPREALIREAAEVLAQAGQVEQLNEFELVTAIAFCYFAREACDVVVAEVGLGGRFDATNVLPPPVAAAITPISLDHTALLGESVEAIAREKCGIIKVGGGPVIAAAGQPPAAAAVIAEACRKTGCALRLPEPAALQTPAQGLWGNRFVYKQSRLETALAGQHQMQNAMTAWEVCRALGEGEFPALLHQHAIERGIAAARIPARLETICSDPLVLLDGAHNPAGAAALAAALKGLLARELPLTAVIGMMADKDSAQALRLLAPCFRRMLCVTPAASRALPAEELARRAGAAGAEAQPMETVAQALAWAIELAKGEGGAVVVCGSLYLAAQAGNLLR